MDVGTYKFCFIGVPNDLVRKIVIKYTDSKISSDDTWKTLGVDVLTKRLEIGDIKVKLVMVIVSSDLHFYRIRKAYYEGGFGVIFMYDKEKPDSIESMDQHISEAKQILGNEGIFISVGVETGGNLISTNQGQQIAKEMGVAFSEIKENDQIAFTEIVKNLVREFLARDSQ